MGAAAADYDNDGHVDLFVPAWQNQLLRIRQRPVRDVTTRAGIASGAWRCRAGLDYDNDGRLDLLVVNYVQWSPETNRSCGDELGDRSYCDPESSRACRIGCIAIAATGRSRTCRRDRVCWPTSARA